MLIIRCVVAVCVVLFSGVGHAIVEKEVAVLGFFDRTATELKEFKVLVNTLHSIETLQVTLRACQMNGPDEQQGNAAYLEIVEVKNIYEAHLRRQDPVRVVYQRVFKGWMFALSPGVSSMEHAIYDLWLIRCE